MSASRLLEKFWILMVYLTWQVLAAMQPNIVWITTEDNSPYWLGCYGNPVAQTPHIDSLAAEGVRFTNAFSNAPVCAVARSTLFFGAYAPSIGTHHMRSRHAIPGRTVPYVHYLREAGYYCTNSQKTDYNYLGDDRSWWDACSKEAHYKNRAPEQPFFAVFNIEQSHESSLFPRVIADRRKRGVIPIAPRVSPGSILVPPYLPDLPQVRYEIASYHDMMTFTDERVGRILAELEAEGLADETIVFYYSDHGGPTPRTKRYLYDTGVKVPLIIRVPEKWRDRVSFDTVSSELVSFVDFAPSILSLVGLQPTAGMQGRPFLGVYREAPEPDAVQFLYADRFDKTYGMSRGITDGRWKYIRRFASHQPAAPLSGYPMMQAGWSAWQRAWKQGQLSLQLSAIWERPQAIEILYDTEADPWELTNLAADPRHAERLLRMRAQLQAMMIEVLDAGLVPEPMFDELCGDRPLADYVASRQVDWPALVDYVFYATSGDADFLPELEEGVKSKDPLKRFWAIRGLLILNQSLSSECIDRLLALLEDVHLSIRVEASLALALTGEQERAAEQLMMELQRVEGRYQQQQVLNAIDDLKVAERVPEQWVEATLADLAASGRKPQTPFQKFATELADIQ